MVKHKIRDLYYKIRAIFFPYTVIKSRYLPRTWVDKDELLAQTIMEIVSRFIEDELKYDDSYDSCDKCKFVAKKLREMYEWYHHTYIPYYTGKDDVYNHLVDQYTESFSNEPFTKKNKNGLTIINFDQTKESIEIGKRIDQYERNMSRQLTRYCAQAVLLRDYMWT